MKLSNDEIDFKNTVRPIIVNLIKKYQSTFDENLIKHIIPNMREYIAVVCKENDISISKHQLTKISKSNFNPLINYMLSGNIGYIRDYIKIA